MDWLTAVHDMFAILKGRRGLQRERDVSRKGRRLTTIVVAWLYFFYKRDGESLLEHKAMNSGSFWALEGKA